MKPQIDPSITAGAIVNTLGVASGHLRSSIRIWDSADLPGLANAVLASVVLILWVANHHATGALVEYSLNEGTGTVANSVSGLAVPATFFSTNNAVSSSFWGYPGSGVSTVSTDFAFDTRSASGMGTQHRGPHLRVSPAPFAVVSNFTISGWFRPATGDLNRAILLTCRKSGAHLSLVGLSGGPANARSRLRFLSSAFLTDRIDAASQFDPKFSTGGEWAFFAVVCETGPSTRKISFVSGSATAMSELSSEKLISAVVPLDLSNATLLIGSGEGFEDPFQGHLDNVAIHLETLSLEEIERVRLQALFPEKLRLESDGRLTWPTVRGRTYHLEGSPDLKVWSTIVPPIAGDGTDYNYDASFRTEAQGFYRLRFR